MILCAGGIQAVVLVLGWPVLTASSTYATDKESAAATRGIVAASAGAADDEAARELRQLTLPPRPEPNGRFTVVAVLARDCCGYVGARTRAAELIQTVGLGRIDFVDMDFSLAGPGYANLIAEWQPIWAPPDNGPPAPYTWEPDGGFRAGPGNYFIFDPDGYLLRADIPGDALEAELRSVAGVSADDC